MVRTATPSNITHDAGLGWSLGGNVTGVTDDSRRVQPGFIFVAVRGLKDDGRSHAQEAALRGAVAILAQPPLPDGVGVPVLAVPSARKALAEISAAFYGHPARQLQIVGVTGTAGKSTTVEWLLSVLRGGGRKVEALGSLHMPGVPEGSPGLTTPGSVVLQRVLGEFREQGAQMAVLEITSHAIHQHRVHSVPLSVLVMTTLGRDHLDYHKTLSRYWATKRSLFKGLSPDALAVFPMDPVQEAFIRKTPARVLRYGRGGDVELRAIGPFKGGAYQARLVSSFGNATFRFHLPGPGMVRSAAAAATVGLALGLQPAQVAHALETVREIPGRLEAHLLPGGVTVLIDFGHNPPGLRTALQAAREVAGRKRVTAVFGAPGHRDWGKLPEMGRIAAQTADRVIVTDESPEGDSAEELAKAIFGGALEAGGHPEYIPDRLEAVYEAAKDSKEGDVILLAGRGRERFQDFGSHVLWRSDLEIIHFVKDALLLGTSVSRPAQ